jgi:hypothetical protein
MERLDLKEDMILSDFSNPAPDDVGYGAARAGARERCPVQWT